ncbi:hypothetical protein Tco_0118080 [Tanacetum coccineum]|uniref:Uncharacterized protein n=1 Tax=Tanacetum coccineum TaxID=301880 RepID=A0ABQ5D196_9ASTR
MGLSSLRLAEGSSNGGDEVGTDMGKGGGIPDDGALTLMGGVVEKTIHGVGTGELWNRKLAIIRYAGCVVVWPQTSSSRTALSPAASWGLDQ